MAKKTRQSIDAYEFMQAIAAARVSGTKTMIFRVVPHVRSTRNVPGEAKVRVLPPEPGVTIAVWGDALDKPDKDGTVAVRVNLDAIEHWLSRIELHEEIKQKLQRTYRNQKNVK